MNYKVISKFVKYDPMATEVRIMNETPYTLITRDVKGDVSGMSDAQLIQEVLHMVSIEVDPTTEINKLREEIVKVNEKADMVVKSIMNFAELDTDTRNEIIDSYPAYEVGVKYEAGKVINFEGKLYRVVQEHVSQADWAVGGTPALYTEYLNFNANVTDPGTGEVVDVEVINDFVPPTSAADAYKKGDKMRYNGAIYESLIDGNVWTPTDNQPGWKYLG